MDANLPNSRFYPKNPENAEAHEEDADRSFKSNVKNAQHPIFSGPGLLQTINFARGMANTVEKQLSGEIKDKVFEDVANVSRKTKVPSHFLLFMMDWEKDITSYSDGQDANSIANKVMQNVNQLRSTLGRDPLFGEVFMAHVFGSAEKVKTVLDNAKNKPEEIAKSQGGKKDDIVLKKQRNGKSVDRKWRELADFFMNRIPIGHKTYKQYLGQNNDTSN
jgi:hypothetical protein